MVFVARARRGKMLARRAISSFGKGMFTMFTCVRSCYRFLRKSEETHFLAVIFREWMVGQKFLKHTVRVREEALDIAIIFLHYCFS